MAGQLIERGERKWLVRIFLGRGPDGKRRYLNQTIHGSKKDAQRILNEKLHQHDRGLLVIPSKMLLREYLLNWIDKGKPGISDKSRESYRWVLVNYVIPSLGDWRLAQITPLNVLNRPGFIGGCLS
jgi:integrase